MRVDEKVTFKVLTTFITVFHVISPNVIVRIKDSQQKPVAVVRAKNELFHFIGGGNCVPLVCLGAIIKDVLRD